MARCGCSGAAPCSCFLEAGPGITVEGSGSPGTPYVISIDSGATTVQDTPTINMSITGSGTSGDPFVISGSVKLDPSVDNVLAATANGLILTCDTIRDCAGGIVTILDTSTVNLTLTGDGSSGNPYVISAAVKLSVTAGNLITADGTGIYLSCAQVRTCLSAGDGLNYDSATGIFEVQISTDPGNTTVIGTDGGVYTPPGSGVFTDCGLTGLGTLVSPLAVDTGGSAWPFGCDEDQGAAVYCGSDGALRVDPEKFVVYDYIETANFTGEIDSFGATVGGGVTDLGAGPVDFVINNPSNCRDMVLFVEAGVAHCRVDFDNGPNDIAIGAHFVGVGDITPDETEVGHQRWKATGTADYSFDVQGSMSKFTYTLGPGDSVTFSLYATLQIFSYTDGDINQFRAFLDVKGFNL